MKILFVGDIVGSPGRAAVKELLPGIQREFSVDITVVNAENAAGGLGATPEILQEILGYGVQAVTMGNHTWRKKVLIDTIDRFPQVVRPGNYPAGTPGQGAAIIPLPDGRKFGLVNVLGRVFMEAFACPFETARSEVEMLRESTANILVDVHAEATSEKVAMGWYLDGLCSAVVGTHTHVQTADERILPRGTAYITDVGMTGPRDGVIGVERDKVIGKFLTGLPADFKVARTQPMLNGVVIDTDDETGRAITIERIQRLTSHSK